MRHVLTVHSNLKIRMKMNALLLQNLVTQLAVSVFEDRNLVFVRYKNRQKHNQQFQLFQYKFILWYVKLNVYIWKTKFTSQKQYSFGLLFSENAKEIYTDPIILNVFSLCPKRTVLQNFKSSSHKNLFPKCVCYRLY